MRLGSAGAGRPKTLPRALSLRALRTAKGARGGDASSAYGAEEWALSQCRARHEGMRPPVFLSQSLHTVPPETSKSWLLQRSLLEQRRGPRVQKHPERINAQCGTKRKTEQVQHGHDQREDPSPLLVFQQANTGDDPWDGDDQKDDSDGHSDRSADEKRLTITRQRAGASHDHQDD